MNNENNEIKKLQELIKKDGISYDVKEAAKLRLEILKKEQIVKK